MFIIKAINTISKTSKHDNITAADLNARVNNQTIDTVVYNYGEQTLDINKKYL